MTLNKNKYDTFIYKVFYAGGGLHDFQFVGKELESDPDKKYFER